MHSTNIQVKQRVNFRAITTLLSHGHYVITLYSNKMVNRLKRVPAVYASVDYAYKSLLARISYQSMRPNWHAIDQHSSQTTTTCKFCKIFVQKTIPWVLRHHSPLFKHKWVTNSNALSHMLFITDNHPRLPRRPSVDHAVLSS